MAILLVVQAISYAIAAAVQSKGQIDLEEGAGLCREESLLGT